MSDVTDSTNKIGGLEKINTLWKQYNNLINTKPSGYAANEEVPFKNYVINNDIFNEDVPENILITNDTSLNVILPNNETIEFIITANDCSTNNNYLNINILDNLFDQSDNILVGSKCNFENLGYKHIEFYYKKECYPTIYNTTNQLYTWFIPDPSNGNITSNQTNNLLKNTIAYLYDPYYNTYKYQLFYKSNTSFYTINFASSPDFAYLDNKSGFLYFYGGTRTNNIVTLANIRSQSDSNPSPPYISYIRYNGNVGFNNLNLRGNITIDNSLSIINDNVYNDISNLDYNVLNTQQIRQYIENLNISGGSSSGLTLDQILNSNNDASFSNVDISGTLFVDTINNKTHLNGISLESINIKGPDITNVNVISAQNYNLGNTNVISASRQGNFRDIEMKNNSNNTTFLAYGDTGNIDIYGTLSVDTINEKTDGSGVTIDGVLIKDNNINANTFTGNLIGNAGTATVLETARTIGGVSFDGSADIDLSNIYATNTLFNELSSNFSILESSFVNLDLSNTLNAIDISLISLQNNIGLSENISNKYTFDLSNINNIELVNENSTVNVVNSKYIFNGSNSYDASKKYGLRTGNYVLINIPQNHPIALLNNDISNVISYSGDASKISTKNVTGTNADGNYNFYYGDVSINVIGNFNQVSVYCYNHGYMGGENLLQYVSNYYTTNNNSIQDLSALFFNTITPSKNSSNILININASLYCSYALEERISIELWRDLSMLNQNNHLGSIIATGGLTIPYNFNYLDSPNTNNLVKYYLKYKLENNNSAEEMGIINIQTNSNYGSSNIILREL